MDKSLASSQYIARGDLATARQAIVESLCAFNVPHIIGEGTEVIPDNEAAKVIRLFALVWKGIGQIELEPVDSTQTLVRFCLPGYPDEVETSWYEEEIRRALPPLAVAIRLMDVEGDRRRALLYLGRYLHQFRLQCLRDIQRNLVNAVGLISLQGLPLEKNRYPDSKVDQPEQRPAEAKKTRRDIPQADQPLRADVRILLRMWQSGHTAKEIALRTSRTEKTILNQLTLLRKSLGEEMVPRRR
jgi:DNA-binding CsgD family transcriptional regulator